ncbi:MAG: hypothetical protein AAGC93_19865 [Cyanobacteria bacterium P01_F01_bin.53]
MENGTEGLSHPGSEAKIGASLEVNDIYERIERLSKERKAQLIDTLIRALTTDEIADVLDEIAVRLRNAGN